MEAAMDLMRRMPPRSAETALNALLSLLPDHSLDLLSQVDLPLQVKRFIVFQVCMDKESLKEYILCEYNRDADSYRSPWSNKYDPPLEDGTVPSQGMRNLEVEANEVFSVYRDQWTRKKRVGPEEEGAAHYCLNSTVMLSLTTNNKQSGTFNLSGSIRRQMSMTLAVADGHLVNMGKMIEEMEGKLRNSLDQVYFGKTREMVCTLRPPPEVLNMRLPDS
ncbi:putative F-actin-capping protein subunit beta [Zea mays]|uniref:F-actin-capping protein subunit beta n=1 Tax=Zea mays TaxID=4577 RepID=A0A1D6K4K0_MAIZE|nr:putative F-actin-capping protein subunit beta [Zea mays]ONL98536.1 putative F-actin-capping protein subunit beta [Zea mays]